MPLCRYGDASQQAPRIFHIYFGRGQGNWSASGRGATVEALRKEIAKAIGAPRSIGAREAAETLETGLLKLHSVAALAGGVSKSIFTQAELDKWHAKNLPQNVPEYRRLSGSFSGRLRALPIHRVFGRHRQPAHCMPSRSM